MSTHTVTDDQRMIRKFVLLHLGAAKLQATAFPPLKVGDTYTPSKWAVTRNLQSNQIVAVGVQYPDHWEAVGLAPLFLGDKLAVWVDREMAVSVGNNPTTIPCWTTDGESNSKTYVSEWIDPKELAKWVDLDRQLAIEGVMSEVVQAVHEALLDEPNAQAVLTAARIVLGPDNPLAQKLSKLLDT